MNSVIIRFDSIFIVVPVRIPTENINTAATVILWNLFHKAFLYSINSFLKNCYCQNNENTHVCVHIHYSWNDPKSQKENIIQAASSNYWKKVICTIPIYKLKLFKEICTNPQNFY